MDSTDAIFQKCKEALSILTDDDYLTVKNAYKKYGGHQEIGPIRALIRQSSMKTDSDVIYIDPSLYVLVNAYINYPIFITKNNIYSKEEICKEYPFAELGTSPENVFDQQEIGKFTVDKSVDYLFRDASDEPFYYYKDDYNFSTNNRYKRTIKPDKVIKSFIYKAGERFEDFTLMKKFVRGFQQFIPIEGGATFGQAVKALPFFLASMGSNGQLLLESAGAPIEESTKKPSPKKSRSKKAKNTEDSAQADQPKKRRGRPKKNKD
jgi:hypothetical protein